jgi:hemolysin activation/secretion protein
MRGLKKSVIAVGVWVSVAQSVVAQQSVDPRVSSPRLEERLPPPKASPDFFPGTKLPQTASAPGAERFQLRQIRFVGNSVLSAQELGEVVKPKIGQTVDFAALQAMADDVSDFYRQSGYPFARAYLLPQDIAGGVLTLTIREGKYGEIFATAGAESAWQRNANAQEFLGELRSDAVIGSKPIERIGLIMNDLPGYSAVPIVRPGAEVGSGDLEMRLTERPQLQGAIGIDNHGSKITGQNRIRFDIERSRNFLFGDVLKVSGLTTDGKTRVLTAAYGFPVMARGARLDLSALQSSYVLGGILSSSNFSGDSNIYGARLSYPIIRSQAGNLAVSGSFQQRRFTNDRGQVEKYVIHAWPLALNFDWKDSLNGGAVTYGALSYQQARVARDNVTTASRDRHSSKVNLDVARIQRLTTNLQATLKYSGQFTQDNVDATDFISLAGPDGVRSYPVGEFSGHVGWIGQAELAYAIPAVSLTPYVFYDRGSATNRTTTMEKFLHGKGVGLRYVQKNISLDLAASWISKGGVSQAEPESTSPRYWAKLSVGF